MGPLIRSMLPALALALPNPAAAGDRGYALWNADSDATPGAEVTVKLADYADHAVLRPVAAIRTLAPLIDLDKNRVILPAGGMLAQMSGGRSGEYCTSNHGAKLRPPGLAPAFAGGLLCFAIDAQGNSTGLHYISAVDAAVLREYGIDFAGGAKRVNAVKVEPVEPERYDADVWIGVVASMRNSRDGKRACLKEGSSAAGLKAFVFSQEACFGGPGQSVSVGSGRYTLVSFDPRGKTMRVRIDRPIHVRGMVPKVV